MSYIYIIYIHTYNKVMRPSPTGRRWTSAAGSSGQAKYLCAYLYISLSLSIYI